MYTTEIRLSSPHCMVFNAHIHAEKGKSAVLEVLNVGEGTIADGQLLDRFEDLGPDWATLQVQIFYYDAEMIRNLFLFHSVRHYLLCYNIHFYSIYPFTHFPCAILLPPRNKALSLLSPFLSTSQIFNPLFPNITTSVFLQVMLPPSERPMRLAFQGIIPINENFEHSTLAIDDIFIRAGGCDPPGYCTFDGYLCTWFNNEHMGSLVWESSGPGDLSLETRPFVDSTQRDHSVWCSAAVGASDVIKFCYYLFQFWLSL